LNRGRGLRAAQGCGHRLGCCHASAQIFRKIVHQHLRDICDHAVRASVLGDSTGGPISWRWVMAAGALPALIAIAIRLGVSEPERWERVRAETEKTVERNSLTATFAAIFAPDLRRRTIVGFLVSSAMMIGCWGGLTLLPSWIQQLVRASGGTGPVAGASLIFPAMRQQWALALATTSTRCVGEGKKRFPLSSSGMH
jgi:hypothetical protein